MSKSIALLALGTVLVLGACAKHKAPAPEPVAPVYVEPVSVKGK
jgi:hypothetical protein